MHPPGQHEDEGETTLLSTPDGEPEESALDEAEHADGVVEFNQRRAKMGRLISRRGHGKTSFLDLRDLSGSMQIAVRLEKLGRDAYGRILNLDVGDIIGVQGCIYVTQRGQLALAAN